MTMSIKQIVIADSLVVNSGRNSGSGTGIPQIPADLAGIDSSSRNRNFHARFSRDPEFRHPAGACFSRQPILHKD